MTKNFLQVLDFLDILYILHQIILKTNSNIQNQLWK